ncbi:MAG: TIGR04282 family arsenosugar biosynthesis glycosyltransferase [Pyrinomonadaceae bacterium]|nr:TIGR04282 family arsenosugar biosynthesis glycosyltransferase [Pyrinomonadaceae bacterium]
MISSYAMLDPRSPDRAAARGKCALGIMIKAPRAGASKTRLAPPLALAESAALSVCFLRDTAQNIHEAAGMSGVADGVAVYTPVGAEAAFDELLPDHFRLLPQRGESFGERLYYAAEDFMRLGYAACCLIDSDSPTLPRAALVAASNQLARPGDRVVLGPADDGGYYLIGLKRAHRKLFEEITWSTDLVLAETIERAEEIKLEVELLPAWYDVDDQTTLARLCEELFAGTMPNSIDAAPPQGYQAPHTRAFLSALLEREGRARIWPMVSAKSESPAEILR